MRRVASVFAFAFLSVASFAQPITVVYDKLWGGTLNDAFHSVQVDAAGNVYVVGRIELNAALTTHRVIKFGPTGATLWSVDHVTSSSTQIASKLLGSVLLVQSGSSGNVLTTSRFDTATGALLWQTSDVGQVEADPAIAASRSVFLIDDGFQSITARCRSNGNGSVLWSMPLGISAESIVLPDPSGDFVVLTTPAPKAVIVRKLSKIRRTQAPPGKRYGQAK